MRLNVFGRRVEAERRDGRWTVYYLGEGGLKRVAQDIVVLSDIDHEALPGYLADLCHEWATAKHGSVEVVG